MSSGIEERIVTSQYEIICSQITLTFLETLEKTDRMGQLQLSERFLEPNKIKTVKAKIT